MKNKFHHYISQFYLKKFAHTLGSKKTRMYMYDVSENKENPRALIGRNAGENYFNQCFGSDPMAIEHFYARKIEAPAGAALKRTLDSGKLLNSDDLSDILLFLAMTTTRNPEQRAKLEEPARRLDLMVLKTALGDAASQQMADRSSRNLSSKEHVATEVHLIAPIHESLCKKSWTLLVAPNEGGGFITSDNPLRIISAAGIGNWGFETEGAVLFAPISPKFALYGKEGLRANDTFPLTVKQVAYFNFGTVAGAHRCVFGKSNKFNVIHKGDLVTWKNFLSLGLYVPRQALPPEN